ncbi:hypothetical protein Q5424_11505 [Conexibacter sp. JD483]|uniref:hypothetical protein n=1 Tax=unclassified Conexibacter TaxID=2627773 RepID=UPI0027191D4A|nr:MULTISPECIES: hypothetical protein [unclassified Conexibacter]MDO8187965.1 hypothetical protein [Conexibacter sp. CPCC 205706]MDO8200166.1 hypothetical protein [Conexibacter sp. CPCC 205762]MDR9369712.1 hypothetical protein [Conexibacter sp. JD483]
MLLVSLAVLAAPAGALPGDPPITSVSPGDGAQVKADRSGIEVRFGCPAYRKDVFGDVEAPIVDVGSAEDYDVAFSPAPALDARGVLATRYASARPITPSGDGATCTTVLDTEDSATSPEQVGGRVFWQVSRSCVGCGGSQLELGPVRSFRVTATPVASRIAAPRAVYAGYLTKLQVRSDAEVGGAQVTLQRQAGRRWVALGRAAYGKRTDFYVTLPAGRQRLRAVVETAAARSAGSPRELRVRPDRGRVTSARDDGAYAAPAGKAKVAFRVTGGGRLLRDFSASVTAFCIGPTVETNGLQILFAGVESARIAPDGSVTGRLQTKSRRLEAVVIGRLRDGRFSGEASISIATSRCSGTRSVTAAKRR